LQGVYQEVRGYEKVRLTFRSIAADSTTLAKYHRLPADFESEKHPLVPRPSRHILPGTPRAVTRNRLHVQRR
jgi:hypothetical protein